MILAIGIVASLALVAWVTWAGGVVLRSIAHLSSAPPPVATTVQPEDLDALALTFRGEIELLSIAVSTGIAHVNRHEKRVQKTVASARRLLKENGIEHAALDAEAEEIQQTYDIPREAEPVPPVREGLDDSGPSGVPGLSRQGLANLRGR